MSQEDKPAVNDAPDPEQLAKKLPHWDKSGHRHTNHPSQPLGGALQYIHGVDSQTHTCTESTQVDNIENSTELKRHLHAFTDFPTHQHWCRIGHVPPWSSQTRGRFYSTTSGQLHRLPPHCSKAELSSYGGLKTHCIELLLLVYEFKFYKFKVYQKKKILSSFTLTVFQIYMKKKEMFGIMFMLLFTIQ